MPPRSTVATAAIPGMQYTRATPDTTFFNSLLEGVLLTFSRGCLVRYQATRDRAASQSRWRECVTKPRGSLEQRCAHHDQEREPITGEENLMLRRARVAWSLTGQT